MEALEAMVMLPLAAPAACGVKVTVKVALCPAARVSGAEIPLSVKPAPLTVARETVTAAVPVLVMVPDSGSLLPTCTVPKLPVAALKASCPLPVIDVVAADFAELNPWQPIKAARLRRAKPKETPRRAFSMRFGRKISFIIDPCNAYPQASLNTIGGNALSLCLQQGFA